MVETRVKGELIIMYYAQNKYNRVQQGDIEGGFVGEIGTPRAIEG
jgi:hypothetical protein